MREKQAIDKVIEKIKEQILKSVEAKKMVIPKPAKEQLSPKK